MKIAEEDFDPTRVLDGWRPPSDAAPGELDLGVIFGATRRATLSEAQLERLRQRGIAAEAVEDVGFAESQSDALPVHGDFVDTVRGADEIDDAGSLAATPNPRLPVDWRPGCWIAVARCLQPPGTLVSHAAADLRVRDVGAQWLVAVWPPQRLDAPLLGRWPQALRVVAAPDEAGAVAALLPIVPPGARLWRAELDVDWGLLAALVAQSDAELAIGLRRALAALAERERVERESRMLGGYACVDGLITRR